MPELKYISFWDERYADEIRAAERYAREREKRIERGELIRTENEQQQAERYNERHRLGKGGYFRAIKDEVGKCEREDCDSVHWLTAHHKTPLSEGGSNRRENIEVLCRDCHDDEHDLT